MAKKPDIVQADVATTTVGSTEKIEKTEATGDPRIVIQTIIAEYASLMNDLCQEVMTLKIEVEAIKKSLAVSSGGKNE